MKSISYFAFCFALSTPLAPPTDRIITTTGKILEGKATDLGEKYKIEFNSISLEIPKKLVKEAQVESDIFAYVPKDDKEKEMVSKGYVKYKNQWIPKDRYLSESKKEREANQKKFEDYKIHQIWGNEWVKSTKHFIVHCNVSPEILDYYAETYEHFFEAYAAKFHINLSPDVFKERMAINIFKSEKDYVEYSKMKDANGHFSAGDRALYLFHDHDDPVMSLATLFHEGTHMINFLVNPPLFGAIPIWVEESTAEYFAHVRYEDGGGKKKIIPGEIGEDRLGSAQEILSEEGAKTHLQRLLNTPQDKFDADCYALGWSFLHFLFSSTKYGPGFTRYCEDIYQARGMKWEKQGQAMTISDEEAIRSLLKYIGAKDIPTLEREWSRYVLGLKQPGGRGCYYRAMAAKWEPQPLTGQWRRLDALDLLNKAIDQLDFKTSQAYYLRAQVHDFRKDREKAMADVKQAIEIDPTNDRYYVAQAWFLYLDKKYAEAETSMRIAIALDPTESDYEVYLGELVKKAWKVTPIQRPKAKQ